MPSFRLRKPKVLTAFPDLALWPQGRVTFTRPAYPSACNGCGHRCRWGNLAQFDGTLSDRSYDTRVPLAMFWRPTTPRGDQGVISNSTHPSVFSDTTAPDGRLALLLALYIGSLAPLSLLVIGETFEHALPGNFFSASHSDTQLKEWMRKLDKRYAAPVAILERVLERLEESPPRATFISAMLLNEKRRLNLQEEILLAKPTTPKVRALIRANEGQKARTQIEPINLCNTRS